MENGSLWLDDLPYFTMIYPLKLVIFYAKLHPETVQIFFEPPRQSPSIRIRLSSSFHPRTPTALKALCTKEVKLRQVQVARILVDWHTVFYAYRCDKYTHIPASSTVCVLFAFSGTSASLDLGNTYIYIWNMYIRLRLSVYVHANKIK